MTIQPFAWKLQSSINLLNDFCADTQNFSYSRLAALKLFSFALEVDPPNQGLSILFSTDETYQALQWHLNPHRRLYQLLSLHFKKVHLFFGASSEPLDNAIYLDSIQLQTAQDRTELRDINSIGARFRRTLNIALQGHVGVLRFYDDQEIEQLRNLWERGRIEQLLETYDIIPFDDSSGQIIKLWRPRRFHEGEQVIVIID